MGFEKEASSSSYTLALPDETSPLLPKHPTFSSMHCIGFLIGLQVECFHQQAPFNVPHCIARFMKEWNVGPKRTVQDQITPSQHLEHEKAYDIIASLLKIPFLDEDIVNDSYPCKISDYVEHNDAILLVKIDTYWSPSKQAWQIGFSGNPCTPDS